MTDWLQQFECVEQGFFVDQYYDEEGDRWFWETPESIVRRSKFDDSIYGEWSVSEHSLDFFDVVDGKLHVPPERYHSEDAARERVDELVDAHR